MSQRQVLIERLGDQERAAAELFAFQREAVDYPHLYRIAYNPRPRQPEDVEMCHWLSWWLCQYYRGEI